MTMLGRGGRSGDKADGRADKARRAEEAARRAEELAEQARKAAEEAKAALREAEETEEAEAAPEAADGSQSAAEGEAGTDAEDTDAEDDAEDTDAEDDAETDAGDGDADADLDAEDDAGDGGEDGEAGSDAEAKVLGAGKAGEETATDDTDDIEDDADDADDEESEPVAKRQKVVVRTGLGASGVVLLLLTVALGGALGWLWYKNDQLSGAEEARKQVAFAAAQAAQDLSSYDYRTVDSDLRRAAQHTTGKFHDEFVKQAERVKATARQQQTVTEGVAIKTGIEEVSGSKATALVFLNQQTAKTGTTERLPNQYTLRLTMKKVGGRWLVEKLQVV